MTPEPVGDGGRRALEQCDHAGLIDEATRGSILSVPPPPCSSRTAVLASRGAPSGRLRYLLVTSGGLARWTGGVGCRGGAGAGAEVVPGLRTQASPRSSHPTLSVSRARLAHVFGSRVLTYPTRRLQWRHSPAEGCAMSYRRFTRPNVPFYHNDDWITWLETERVLYSPAPAVPDSCRLCFGPVRMRNTDGAPFRFCKHCCGYRGILDALVPITYSFDDGLESILHGFKDKGIQWFSEPLGSMVSTFLQEHKDCIERRIGGRVDVAAPVPPDNTARQFDHISSIVNGVHGCGQLLPWHWNLLGRNRSVDRPARGAVVSWAYDLVLPESVRRKRVLLFDDTWTSGASIVSCAKKLKEHGAVRVCALTLGRQLNADKEYGNSREVITHARQRGRGRYCVLCSS